MREVYVKIGEEIIGDTPVNFIEFKEFWDTHTDDNGYVMIYLDNNNKIVQ